MLKRVPRVVADRVVLIDRDDAEHFGRIYAIMLNTSPRSSSSSFASMSRVVGESSSVSASSFTAMGSTLVTTTLRVALHLRIAEPVFVGIYGGYIELIVTKSFVVEVEAAA